MKKLTGVPNLNADSATRFERDWFRRKFNSNSRPFALGQLTFDVAAQQVCLADIRISEQDDFEYEVIIVVVPCVHVNFCA